MIDAPETDITAAIIGAIRAMGHLAWRNKQFNKGKIGGGLGKGSPDIIACVNGRFCALETKRPGRKRQHKEHVAVQGAWLDDVADHRGVAAVVTSVAEAVRIVRNIMTGDPIEHPRDIRRVDAIARSRRRAGRAA